MKISKKLLLSLSAAVITVIAMAGTVTAASQKTGVVTGTVVNFRKEPNLSSKVLLKLEKGTKVTVIDSKGDWYNVVYNDAYGWMHQDWVQVRDKSIAVGIVTGTVVNVRSKPDINSEVITKFNKGTKVEIYEKSGKWYRVAIGEERHGWMHSDWVAIKEESVSRGSAQPERPDDDSKAAGTSDAGDKQDGAVSGDKGGTADLQDGTDPQEAGDASPEEAGSADGSGKADAADGAAGNDAADEAADNEAGKDAGDEAADNEAGQDATEDIADRQAIIDYAKTLIGIKYVYGGETTKGFDCSGFVKYVFNHFGISLERTSRDQARGGKPVKKSELKPGDLVFFDTVDDGALNDISHVGIYIGDGKFIHASTYLKKAITIESLSSS